MSELKATPGPWEYDDSGCDGDVYSGTPFVDCLRIAQGVRLNDKPLIAAAPELYDALDLCLEQLMFSDGGEPLSFRVAITAAKQALAKARGEI
jgi:hypothetical protein